MDDESQPPRRRRTGRLSPQGVVVVVEAVVAGIAGVFLTTDSIPATAIAAVAAVLVAGALGVPVRHRR
ncbi:MULTISPECIES: hypothetical protein [Asanoa]|uniref:Uncharacterized protein n=2 Tax=Asanoa TaxID=195964 RepID=A0A239PGL2_9ACTN|nr:MULTISPECIES: hypothetical protein [Asanoa]GIF74247.1 hypothetical protein Asi02nite_37650 [Asanoa siamensis]SNT66276.1 hypothetical protein SAMN05421812_13623 [Asanoa hainanensis]